MGMGLLIVVIMDSVGNCLLVYGDASAVGIWGLMYEDDLVLVTTICRCWEEVRGSISG